MNSKKRRAREEESLPLLAHYVRQVKWMYTESLCTVGLSHYSPLRGIVFFTPAPRAGVGRNELIKHDAWAL